MKQLIRWWRKVQLNYYRSQSEKAAFGLFIAADYTDKLRMRVTHNYYNLKVKRYEALLDQT